ncbi:MAG: DUF3160 domain-containing protein [Chloroflexota bacterium]|nr:DUF3160 domain-containing protein [Chloroflexota bacterium]
MFKRLVLSFALATTLIASCAPAPAITPGSTATPAPPQPVDTSRAGGFAAYAPVPVDIAPAAPAYTPALDEVANPDMLAWLNDAQRAALETNGFVVAPQGYEQIYQIYKNAADAGVPAFVTTDAVLHAFHIFYDYSLRLAEIEHFIAGLEALNAALLEAAQADYVSTDARVQEAAWQNLAFFAVATKLLTPGADVPAPVRDVVEQELELIEAHEGFDFSPIFNHYREEGGLENCKYRYCEDYSQYVPRGHYTRNEDFERYFRAMMWYGRMGFHLAVPRDPEAAQRETRSALLIVRALYNARAGGEPALDAWERIYEPTAFFVGAADDLTVYDYAAVADEVYGGLPDGVALADAARLDEFIAAAQELRPPAIVGGLVGDTEDPEEVTMGFRFMGQRFIPDSYMFQQLVYDQVGLYQGADEPFTLSPSAVGPIRGFPRGLDVQAVLGSGRALEILTAEGDTDYDGYAEQLAKLQDEFAGLPEEQWVENLYWNWLYTLRPLLEEKGEGYPAFMQSPAWADKETHTWLGSWAELRHDTILYAKQSYTILAESAMLEPEPAQGYVEPQPEVYARLVALTAQMRAGLGNRGLLNDEMGQKLERMEALLLTLKTISEKELRGEGLTDAEYATIRFIGDTLENLTTFSEEIEGEITSEADERMALIADVHTDTNTGKVLEEGVGDAFPIYVVVLVEGRQVIAMGGTFSYYEFKQPLDDRLTDEAWQEMAPLPDRPAWTGSFIVE